MPHSYRGVGRSVAGGNAMKRRVLVRVAAASVVLVIAVACSNGGSSTPEATGGGSSATTNPADMSGTIRLLSYSDGFDGFYVVQLTNGVWP